MIMSNFEENRAKIKELEHEILSLDPESKDFKDLNKELNELKKQTYSNLSHWEKVLIARADDRPKASSLLKKSDTQAGVFIGLWV